MHNLDFFVKWTLEIDPGIQQKILSGLRRKSNPMTLMMSSLKATFPPTFCTGRRYYSQVWWRQFPYSDPNLNKFSKPKIFTKNFKFLHLYFVMILKEWKYNFGGTQSQILSHPVLKGQNLTISNFKSNGLPW